MATVRDIELPGIPVVDDGMRCVGIITESDLIMAGVTRVDVLDALIAD